MQFMNAQQTTWLVTEDIPELQATAGSYITVTPTEVQVSRSFPAHARTLLSEHADRVRLLAEPPPPSGVSALPAPDRLEDAEVLHQKGHLQLLK